jgi:hypothetical protein
VKIGQRLRGRKKRPIEAIFRRAVYPKNPMQRAWDIVVGLFMVLASLICQAIVILVVVGLLCAGIASYFDLQSEKWIWVVEIVVAVALNALTFYEFRRRRIAHRMLGLGGGFFLLPRGLLRIMHGREVYLETPEPPKTS